MNGRDFYIFLHLTYAQEGQFLYRNFTFNSWLYKPDDNTYSFQFNIRNNNPKSIRQRILIAAWDANMPIDDNWLEVNCGLIFHNDCRLYMLNHLLQQHHDLR